MSSSGEDAAGFARRLFRLAVPLVVTMLLLVLDTANVRYWMGRYLHAEGIAVHTTSASVVGLVHLLFFAIATGCSVLVARSVGARDGRGQSLFGAAVLLAIIMGLAIAAIMYAVSGPLSSRLATSSVSPEAIRTFLVWWTLAAAPGLGLAQITVATAGGAGLTRFALSQAVVHISLTSVLLPLFLGPLELGYRAPGIAVACAGLVNTVQLWLRLRVQAAGVLGDRMDRAIVLAPRVWRDVLDVGLPTQASRAVQWLVMLVVIVRIGETGVTSLAGFGIAMVLVDALGGASYGFAQAVQIMMAQRLGARDPRGAAGILRRALPLSLVFPAVSALLLLAFAPTVLWLFTDSQAIHAEGVRASRMMCFTLVPAALWQTMLYAYAAARATKRVLVVTLLAQAIALMIALTWPWDRLIGAFVTYTAIFSLSFAFYMLLSIKVLWRGVLGGAPPTA